MRSMLYLPLLAFTVSFSIMACAKGADAPTAKAPVAAAAPASPAINIVFGSDPNPLRHGDNTLQVTATNPDGSPLNGATVTATFFMPAMPSMNMPEMRNEFPFASKGNGRYEASAPLVMGGTWNVTVTVRTPGGAAESKKFSVIASEH